MTITEVKAAFAGTTTLVGQCNSIVKLRGVFRVTPPKVWKDKGDDALFDHYKDGYLCILLCKDKTVTHFCMIPMSSIPRGKWSWEYQKEKKTRLNLFVSQGAFQKSLCPVKGRQGFIGMPGLAKWMKDKTNGK